MAYRLFKTQDFHRLKRSKNMGRQQGNTMKTLEETRAIAQGVLSNEAKAIDQLKAYIQEDFHQAVKTIYESTGRVVITGIGKSAIIANKIVATLNSTGTRALFMHAADAVHGDIGMVQTNDVIIAISKSGNTPEIKVLAPLLRDSGNTLIAMVGQTDSYLAKQAELKPARITWHRQPAPLRNWLWEMRWP